jgi:hypothetical protein
MKNLLSIIFIILFSGCGAQNFNGDQEIKIPLEGNRGTLKFSVPKYINPKLAKEVPKTADCSSEAAYVLDEDKTFIKITNDQNLVNVLNSMSIRYISGENCSINSEDSLSYYFKASVDLEKTHTSVSIQDSIIVDGKTRYMLATASGNLGNATLFFHEANTNFNIVFLVFNLSASALRGDLEKILRSFKVE